MEQGKKRRILFLIGFVLSVALTAASAVILVLSVSGVLRLRIRDFWVGIFSLIIFTFFAVIFFCLVCRSEKTKKTVVRALMIVSLAVYLFLLLWLIVIVKTWANHSAFGGLHYNKFWLRDCVKDLIPFRIIFHLCKKFASGGISFARFAFELGGNMIIYTPFALFAPAFSRRMRKLDSFLPFMVFFAAFVEMIQGMFSLGSCQTDDLILGVGFAVLVHVILNSKKVTAIMEKYYVWR